MKSQTLKGMLVSKGMNYTDCATRLGISKSAFSNKMTGRSSFTVTEIEQLSNLLSLSDTDILDIFFKNHDANA